MKKDKKQARERRTMRYILDMAYLSYSFLRKTALTATALIAGLAPAAPVAAQQEPTMQQQIPRHVLEHERDSFLTLTIENDSLGGGADKDYTSGVRLTYFDVGERPKKLARWLDDLVPTFSINETTSMAWTIGQNLYTPDDISVPGPQPGKRPWAGFLYGSIGLTSLTDNHVDDLEATLGVVGPWAQGERSQKFVHDIINSPDPQGWDNQLENEPGVILSWRRRWPQWFGRSAHGVSFALEPNIGASVGNIYTLAETGLTARLVPSDGRWQDTPVLVRPSIPGSGFFQPHDDAFSWYLFAGVEGRAVAHNIFLDGNTFRDGPDVDKRPFVMDANAGIAFTYGSTRLSYTAVYRTREFDGQAEGAVFGAVSVGHRF